MLQWSITKSERLLAFLKERVDLSTKRVRWLVEHNRCRVNGAVERFCSTRLFKGDRVVLHLDDTDQKLKVLFEDEHLIAYRKPAGFTSERLPHLLVHRLDRDTTGVVLCAKTLEAQNKMEVLFRKREIEKEYIAVVSPPPSGEGGVIKFDMAVQKRREGAVLWHKVEKGLPSETQWEVIKRDRKKATLRLFPKTGRTHQLRLHMRELGCPIVGDVDYGSREQGKVFRPLLHARRLTFTHPITQEKMEIIDAQH
ncbi:MAG: RluA family pseudouridine synthase [Chlamydiales bacterium]|nr:RluA family pseudouridine synthase [Chlamydiales bacterium]